MEEGCVQNDHVVHSTFVYRWKGLYGFESEKIGKRKLKRMTKNLILTHTIKRQLTQINQSIRVFYVPLFIEEKQ